MKKAIIISSIVIAIGVGGYLFYRSQLNRLIDMRYRFEGIRISDLNNPVITLDLKIRIMSESTIEAEITSLDLDVFINGQYVGKVTDNSKVLIPAKGYSIVDVKVAIDTKSVKAGALDLVKQIWSSKDANITLKGKAKVKSWVLDFPVKIDYTESIKYLLS